MDELIGADRRMVRHPAPAGALDAGALPRRPRVVVVGGGIAGLAAATGLAERGVGVEVVEREPHLGGRAGGWTDSLPDGTEVAMSRGFHAFFRQYYNLRGLLRRADPGLERLVALEDYPLLDADGHRDSFRGLPRTPPWNALAFALRSPTFGVADLLRINARAAASLAAVSVPRTYAELDDHDAESFLRDINFPSAARALAFRVFSRSFFAPPTRMSAAELATMFHIYFLGSSEGLVFDVADAGFDSALWEPLREYLRALGAGFRTRTAVTRVQTAGGGFRVQDDTGGAVEADGVVLATDVRGLREVVEASTGLGDSAWRESVRSLRTAPPFLVQRLWLDRPVHADRPAFLGTAGFGPLDNVSVLERFDDDAKAWTRRTGGSVVETHAYSARGGAAETPTALREQLRRVYPETASAGVVGELTRWGADCPLFGVGDFARRPGVRTPHDGLVLAGDGIRIDLPVALMERAATTGWHAANCLLAKWGLAGHPVHTVPTAGRIGPLRWLAERTRQR
ncbi:isorenieratene synthase [Saccharopolyspora erythraea NRRL 2338]|uniref:Beta-carotene desaturase/methylase n=2 Tax=Saccharopolyspora erythraea TaxID=1836 RepID=A4FES1_SACEN|nr:FAD-dependent oxidoreductase [Saccharopolyspora erythraea]PFG96271.1 isorenieratene synthase [Saccharopolyspora erythraea NRRL 2338]QRK92791.1 FAD-dependent oxidoreductase [Saccharopolyspora erythraea]CAM02546.1 beta-carotene desaturase/methylase [Saccharopolyspora erythraea NRRL 2338]